MPTTLRVIVCGDGSAFDEIQKAIAISPHASQIDIRRSVTNEERERLYKTSSLFVMPNIEIAGDMEGFGLVCIEAASFGLPTVAAHTQGIIDAVIENETGLFFPAGNAEAAAEAIRNALEDPLPAAKVHAAFLKSFTIRSVIDQYMQHVFF